MQNNFHIKSPRSRFLSYLFFWQNESKLLQQLICLLKAYQFCIQACHRRIKSGLFVLQTRLPKVQKGKAVGKDCIPNEFYHASGEASQLALAQLLHRARWEGPPMSWRGGLMWARPRKPNLPFSPLNSRALLCADHKANHYSAALRAALAPLF